jgi:hypothetical protein
MLASKLLQTNIHLLAKASTNSEFAIGQKLLVENTTPLEAQLSLAGYQAGYQAGFQAGSIAGFQSPTGSHADSQP